MYSALATAPTWTAQIPTGRLVDSDSIGRADGIQPAFPFAVLKGGTEAPTPGFRTRSQLFDLWVYDKPGDYNRIHEILDTAYGILHRRAGGKVTVGGVDWWLMDSRFQGASPDFKDELLRATVRYATYRVVGSKQ
jgi:hypothetical protein